MIIIFDHKVNPILTESGGDCPPVKDQLHCGRRLALHGVLCEHGRRRGRALQEVEGDHAQQHLRSNQVSNHVCWQLFLLNRPRLGWVVCWLGRTVTKHLCS